MDDPSRVARGVILHDPKIQASTSPTTGPSYSVWAARRFGPKPIEASSFGEGTNFLTRTFGNPLIDAADVAFNHHLPFRLRPEDVWLCLQNGIAQHILQNTEAVRKLFVSHEGQETLICLRDEFIPGSRENDWQGVFLEFSDKIGGHIGDPLRDMFVPTFTTSSAVDVACFRVGLMLAMSPFFRYEVHTRCGIPEFHVLGSEADWLRLRTNFVHLTGLFGDNVHMLQWKQKLLPVLDSLTETAVGRGDLAFWRDMYHENSESGGLRVTGWIRFLFPYEDQRGRIVPSKFDARGTNIANFPSGMAKVPFLWKIYGRDKPMSFLAGHMGTTQDPSTQAIHPITGWAVQEG